MSLFSQSPFPDQAYNFDIRRGHVPGRDYSTIEENLPPVSGYTPAEGDIVIVKNVSGVPRWEKAASSSLGLEAVTTSLATITAIDTTAELDADGEVGALTTAIAASLTGIITALLRLNGTAGSNNFVRWWTVVRGMQPGEYDGIGAGVATAIRGTYVVETDRLANAIGTYAIGNLVIVDGDNQLDLPTSGEAEQIYGVITAKTANTVEVLVG